MKKTAIVIAMLFALSGLAFAQAPKEAPKAAPVVKAETKKAPAKAKKATKAKKAPAQKAAPAAPVKK